MSAHLDMAERDGGESQTTAPEDIGTRTSLPEYARARRRRTRIRKFVRGATGVAALLLLWQAMSVAYNLQQILPRRSPSRATSSTR